MKVRTADAQALDALVSLNAIVQNLHVELYPNDAWVAPSAI
jgi:hypothetical protein